MGLKEKKEEVTEMNRQASCEFFAGPVDFTLAVSGGGVVVIPSLSKCRSC